MKKTLRKPEHWQDFESLCKKLWGELWEIPHEIKKHGRLGQPQAGVDIFGVPKGKSNYYGIQAKGKDDYSKAKIETIEIENEIKKASKFEPKLEVFIIATTSNKDVKIEEYIRKKDVESREKGSFRILLFCWEDIVDLIEENRETFNWYIKENNFRDKFDVDVYVNDENKIEGIINPRFEKTITTYKMCGSKLNTQPLMILHPNAFKIPGISNEINHTWCKVVIIIKNSGSVVIEDWKLNLEISNNIEKINDGFNVNWMMSDVTRKMMYENRTTYGSDEDKTIIYKPLKNSSLIQNDSRMFDFYIKAYNNNENIKISWNLLARDFNKQGTLILKNEPQYELNEEVIWVDSEEKLKDKKISIKDYVVKKA